MDQMSQGNVCFWMFLVPWTLFVMCYGVQCMRFHENFVHRVRGSDLVRRRAPESWQCAQQTCLGLLPVDELQQHRAQPRRLLLRLEDVPVSVDAFLMLYAV